MNRMRLCTISKDERELDEGSDACVLIAGWPRSRNQKLYLELGGNLHQIDSALAPGVSISEPAIGTVRGSPARETPSPRYDGMFRPF